MKKDELEHFYLIGWVATTCLTFLLAYFCYPFWLVGAIPAHIFAALIIFRFDDESDRGDEEEPEAPPEPGLQLDIPKEEYILKRVGNNDFVNKKKIDKSYCEN